MAFAPIAYIIPQYEDFPNWWIKAYEEGTTTPKVMAIDSSGTPTVAKLQLSGEGHSSGMTGAPITAGNALVIPYIDGVYDLWVFPTEFEADANDTSNAIPLADNIDNNLSASLTAGDIPYTANTTVEERLEQIDVANYAALRALTSLNNKLRDGQTIRETSIDPSVPFVVKTGTVTQVVGIREPFNDDPNRYAERIILDNTYNVKWTGAACDDTTDDRQALIDCINATSPGDIVFIPGICAISDEIVTGKNFNLKGTGKTNSSVEKGGSGIRLLTSTAGKGCLRLQGGTAGQVSDRYIEDITFWGNELTAQTHGLIIGDSIQRLSLNRVSFYFCGRSAIAQDPTQNSYMQNLSMYDVSFYDGGAAYGYTSLPTTGQAYLAGTLMRLSNINIDNSIAEAQTIEYLWDLRAWREITASTFLNEGSINTNAVTSVLGFAGDTYMNVSGCHNEFSGSLSGTIKSAVFEEDATSDWANQQEIDVHLISWNSPYGFVFENNTESRVKIDAWSFYLATQASDLATFGTNGGELDVENLLVKTPFDVPKNLRGRLAIKSVKSRDKDIPLLNFENRPLFYWKAGATDLTTDGKSGFLYTQEFAPSISSKAQEADGNFTVMRYTGTTSIPEVRFITSFPSEYVGSYAVIALHYKCDTDAGNFLALNTNNIGSSDITYINEGIVNTSEYNTVYAIFKITQSAITFFSRTTSTAPTATTYRIAAASLYIGKKVEEPVDITRA